MKQDFYSHAPRGARLASLFSTAVLLPFLLTRPSRGATSWSSWRDNGRRISTHTPLAGRDQGTQNYYSQLLDFYSHAPRGARQVSELVDPHQVDFYSHAPRGARQDGLLIMNSLTEFLLTRPSRGATKYLRRPPRPRTISTHTPLAGRDRSHGTDLKRKLDFYSHAPRGARR